MYWDLSCSRYMYVNRKKRMNSEVVAFVAETLLTEFKVKEGRTAEWPDGIESLDKKCEMKFNVEFPLWYKQCIMTWKRFSFLCLVLKNRFKPNKTIQSLMTPWNWLPQLCYHYEVNFSCILLKWGFRKEYSWYRFGGSFKTWIKACKTCDARRFLCSWQDLKSVEKLPKEFLEKRK